MTNKFIEQRVDELEQELSELKLIVAQIRKPSTVVEEALANDIIGFEGKQYKKVDREARLNDVIIFNSKTHPHNGEQNKPYLINRETAIGAAHYDGISVCDVTFNIYEHGRNIKNVDVYELIAEDKPKTANQLRAEIIEKAKGFIEESKVELTLNRGRGYVIHPGWICDLTFEVNEKKRTVVAILSWKPDHYKKSDVKARGIAKCDPSDVFNEHIGKAIALGRALGLDVSEFEQAVQPTLAVGQIVYFTNSHGSNIHYQIDSKEIIDDEPNLTIVKDYGRTTNGTRSFATFGGNPDVKVVIINDTNAQYGGVE